MRVTLLVLALSLPGCKLFDAPDTEAARDDVQAVTEDVREADALIERAKEAEAAKEAAEAERKILEVRLQEAEMRHTLLQGQLQLARERNQPERVEDLERQMQSEREGRMELGTFVSQARERARSSEEAALKARDDATRVTALVGSLRKEQALLKQRLEAKERRDLARHATQGIEAFEGVSGTVSTWAPWAVPIVGVLAALTTVGKRFTTKTAVDADAQAKEVERQLAELRRQREGQVA